MFSFSVVSGVDVKNILESAPQQAIASAELAYLAHHEGKTLNPDSYFLRFPEQKQNRIIALPAAIGEQVDVAGIKWISSFPDNIRQGIPRASAVLVLNDLATGYPFALLEGSLISAARTAASAVLGAYWINGRRRRAASIAFIGAGIIARNIFDMFLADDWSFARMQVHDLTPDSAAAFAAHAQSRHPAMAVETADLAAALGADIVVFATTAGTPYVPRATRFAAGQIVLNISLRDLMPESLLDANNLFDDVDHCMKADTSPHLAEQLLGDRRFVSGTLAQLMRAEIVLDGSKPTIFSPFGMGILDLALGKHVLAQARLRGLAREIPGFFGETQRW
ncbi:2,3-diaminopropionate biosynthesis protein SbnB [Duganella sp. Root1480D1]|uniref:2,3-diaminopropionate biosynthesis protein SbnB n=1 Tax=Duganella sp. Root1480D1 TaxID=1736471 RepID=UPI00070FACB3|nr:2,3-diaminopropionate biosynthesis protein SbnB [Duganella sp. Root1480D1]KQZ38720.1 2,3-diaminopropionate biosynthesis protein SbnB [Duganella sp. Root1480D1]